MNGPTSLVTIVWLLLAMALAGGTARKQESVNSQIERNIAPSRIALNHNETIISDATSVQQADAWSQFLINVQVSIFNRLSSYAPGAGVRGGGGCDDWGCGMNHNETMLSDATSVQQTDLWSQFLINAQAFIYNRFSSYAPGAGVRGAGGCDDWGCGANHNETMLSDATSVQQTDALSRWLTSVRVYRCSSSTGSRSMRQAGDCPSAATMSGGAARTTTRRWCATSR